MAAPRPCRIASCPQLVTADAPCPTHGRRTTGRSGTGAAWRTRRMWVLKENPYCTTCAAEGLQRLAVEVDHIVPVHRGGSDNYANLAGTCKAHHKVKTASEERQRRAGT